MKLNRYPTMNKWLFTGLLVLASFGCKTQLQTATPAFGVEKGDQFFSIAVLPDTQYYTAMRFGGTMQMFENQINWIKANRKSQNISYVIHLGDVTDRNTPEEWERAKSQLYRLEEDNIPYGVAVGNHDQTPNGNPSKGADDTGYNKYFGKSHFQGKSWYGGAMGNNNNGDNHFDVFEGNGKKYMALYLAFNDPNNKNFSVDYENKMIRWADSVLTVHADRKAIIITHGMVGKPKGSNSNIKPGDGNNNEPSNFTAQGKVIYNMAKHHPNVFLMMGGHISGEGIRKDVYNGSTIKTYLTDYQSRRNAPYATDQDRNGGGGTTRLMKVNTTKQTLSVVTFIPTPTGVVFETDGDSQFTEPLFN